MVMTSFHFGQCLMTFVTPNTYKPWNRSVKRGCRPPSPRVTFAVPTVGDGSPEQEEFAPSLAFDVGSA